MGAEVLTDRDAGTRTGPRGLSRDALTVDAAESHPPLSRSLPSYGSAPAVGLELVTGYDPFNMRHYQRYMDVLEYNKVREPRAAVWTDIAEIRRFDMLAALNVGYVISPQPIEVPSDYALVASLQASHSFGSTKA